MVKIVARDWVDCLQVAKWEGEWKIVNVLWEMKEGWQACRVWHCVRQITNLRGGVCYLRPSTPRRSSPGVPMSVFSTSRRAPAEGAPAPQLSILAHGLHITGEIESDGIVTIEGRLDGVIRGSPQVVVAPGGVVAGNVFAYEVIVGGRVEGDIAATKRVELQAGGVVRGDITAPSIVVDEGGEVNGQFRMQQPSAPLPVPNNHLRLSA